MRSLLVFLKAPSPGRVKTRLAAAIGERAAADAYKEMALAVRREAERLEDVRLLWLYEGDASFPDLSWLGLPGKDFIPQGPGGLGERLERAFASALASGPACAVGTDSPGLPASRFREAFAALESADMVLGPCEDGGYYLLGLKRPAPGVFQGIPWSTGGVLAATLGKARDMGLKTFSLPAYFDVDDAAGLARWRSA